MHFDITAANHGDVVERLCRMAVAAPLDVIEDGRYWYDRAHDAARSLASDLEVPVRNAAGMIAAGSPRIDADDITGQIERVLNGDTHQLTGAHVRRVRMCLEHDPATVLSHRTSPKTHKFFWNVYAPTLRDHVTVDYRHADIIANRMRRCDANRGIDIGGPGTRYESYEYVTEDAASLLRRNGMPWMTAVTLQAILWTEAKRIERQGTTCRGLPRRNGPHRKGQAYV